MKVLTPALKLQHYGTGIVDTWGLNIFKEWICHHWIRRRFWLPESATRIWVEFSNRETADSVKVFLSLDDTGGEWEDDKGAGEVYGELLNFLQESFLGQDNFIVYIRILYEVKK